MSLIVGVLAVVAISTVASVTAEVFVASAEQRDGRRATTTGVLERTDTSVAGLVAMVDVGRAFKDEGGALALLMSPGYQTGLRAVHPGAQYLNHQQVAIEMVAGDLDSVRRLPLKEGRWLSPFQPLPPEIVLNAPAAESWGGVGTSLSVMTSPHVTGLLTRVVGVVFDGDESPRAYLSLAAVAELQPTVLGGTVLTILLHHPSASMAGLTTVASDVATAGSGELQGGTISRTDTVDALLGNLRTQQLAFLGIAVLALVVSAIGMLNVGLASLVERARELVLRRAVGATRTDIAAQVLLAAALLGIAGTIVAVALVVAAIYWWVPTQIPPQSAIEPPGVPWVAVAWGTAAAAVTTLLGSIVPALVAARLDVASILRD